MKIQTKYFGETEIEESKILHFPVGLPAFEDIHDFIMIDLPDNPSFLCLQSTMKAGVAFLLIHPWDFFPDYDIDIPDDDLEELEIGRKEQVLVLATVTIPQDPDQMTANLLAPIIINTETMKGKQVVLHDSPYSEKHPLFPEREAV